MNGISSINCRTQQTSYSSQQKTKALGFGYQEAYYDEPPFELGTDKLKNAGLDANARFKNQVLANQQKMLGLLEEIKTNTKPAKYTDEAYMAGPN